MAQTRPFLKNQSVAMHEGPRGKSVLHELSPSALVHDEQVIVQHIREGRFQRSLSLITAFVSIGDLPQSHICNLIGKLLSSNPPKQMMTIATCAKM